MTGLFDQRPSSLSAANPMRHEKETGADVLTSVQSEMRLRKLTGLIRELQILIEGAQDGGEKDALIEANECLSEALELRQTTDAMIRGLQEAATEPLSFSHCTEVAVLGDETSSNEVIRS